MARAFSLEGRRALVTGANTGIGQGIACALASAGAEVIAAGRSGMTETLDMIAAAGGKAHPLVVDLADKAAAAGLIEQAAGRFGPLDILINNAGIIRRADALDITEDDWDAVLDINLKSTFFLCQAFARHLLGRGSPGKIVNIASLLSF